MAMRPSRRATLRPMHTCGPEPKARCRLGSRPTSSRSGSANSAGSRLAAPMPMVMKVPAGMATPPISRGARRHAVAELVGALEAQQLLHRRADQLRLGDQARLLLRPFEQRVEPVADEIGRGLVAGIEDEDDVVQQLALAQALAVLFALDQPGQHVALGIARMRAPVGDQALEIGEERRTACSPRARCSSSAPARARPGSPATTRAAARAPRAAPPAGCRSPRPARRRQGRG